MTPRVAVVVPVYNEGSAITLCLDRILEATDVTCEVLVVYDSDHDTTIPHVVEYARRDGRVRGVLNRTAPGPAHAIRVGIAAATAPVTIVTMADGSDDPTQIGQLTRLVERGVVIAAASRYTASGRQVGGPLVKGLMSRCAGLSLYHLARVGTRDATNSYKAYSSDFIRQVGIESDAGFELGIELVAKARRLRLPVAEIPTVWLDRAVGQSNFKLRAWLMRYLRWYLFAFGPRMAPDQMLARAHNEEIAP